MDYYLEGTLNITENPETGNTGMHSHDGYEIYSFLGGKADYLVEGNKYRLKKGDIMLMRKGELHINSIRGNSTYKRICINFEITSLLDASNNLSLLDMFDKRPLGEYNHYRAKDFPDNHWQDFLLAICNAPSKEEKFCYLLPLLHELSKCYARLPKLQTVKTPNLVSEICQYINADLTRDLSLEQLSEKYYISKTHLNRLFKTNVGTTVGRYIKLKRLFLAKELLSRGMHPTEVYSRCGFRDYSTFFRAFKNQFEKAPAAFR